MLEYVAYTLLGLLTTGCLPYATMSPEADDAPKSKQPDPKQSKHRRSLLVPKKQRTQSTIITAAEAHQRSKSQS
jgi:hypothetical protein